MSLSTGITIFKFAGIFRLLIVFRIINNIVRIVRVIGFVKFVSAAKSVPSISTPLDGDENALREVCVGRITFSQGPESCNEMRIMLFRKCLLYRENHAGIA